MKNIPAILTIAGSDSGGGAGIQADLKTITMLRGFGMSVVTALTAQNSQGVEGVHAPEPDFVAQQLHTVLSDFSVQAAKTGMLFSTGCIDAVASALQNTSFPVVVDPVCISQTGHALLQADAIEALTEKIVPLATLLTPNKPEAEALTGISITCEDDITRAIHCLQQQGAQAVLIKGGHFSSGILGKEKMMDWLGLPGENVRPLPVPFVQTEHTHGTGCTLSAAIATWLGHGLSIPEAVHKAQQYLTLCLRHAFAPGQGLGPPNHLAPLLTQQ